MPKLALRVPVITALLSTPGFAADMALKAPPPAPPPLVYNWTGFYLGAGYGYGMWNADSTVQTPSGITDFGTNTAGGKGWLATVVAGYDYQFGDHLVAGVLADGDLADLHGTFTDPGEIAFGSGTLTEQSAWAGGARVGWLFAPQLLTYVSGGYTQAHFSSVVLNNHLANGFVTTATLASHTYDGWFVGLGLETTFPFLGNGWFWRTDYRFAEYDSATLPEVRIDGVTGSQTIHPYVQTVRSALIYKFGASGPSPAGLSWADFFAPPPAKPNWTGFYLAAGGGYGMWNIETSDLFPNGTPQVGNYTEGGRGWFGTVNAGYDYQLTRLLVAGAFADFDFANIKGTFEDEDLIVTNTGTMKESSAWATGVRGGWLIAPQILNYYDVGYTQAHFDGVSFSPNRAFFPSTVVSTLPSHTYSGWFFGSGLEAALPFFGNGWFVRAEYRYASYGSTTLTETLTTGGVKDLVTIHPYVQTVRTALVYRF
jgi:outer membrane immunogenic protein